nr:hypothetical protein [Tanacetum cinerariifolium]
MANGAGGVVVEVVGVEGSGENGRKWREKGFTKEGGKYCALHSVLKSGTTRMVLFGLFTTLVPVVRED